MNEKGEGERGVGGTERREVVEAVQAKSKTGSRGKRGMGTVLVE